MLGRLIAVGGDRRAPRSVVAPGCAGKWQKADALTVVERTSIARLE